MNVAGARRSVISAPAPRVGQQSNTEAHNNLNQHLLVCRIVVIAAEDRQVRICCVQSMIDQAAFC